MDQEQQAIVLCQKNEGKKFLWKEQEGVFEIVEDCNCCGASNNVLFCFQSETKRTMLDAGMLLKAFQDRKSVV